MADRRPWWQGAVGYEIYIRSFQDTDGDGVGDMEGIRRRLPYLADLGVNILWITPCFPSPGFDHGYDVSDYRDIDPLFGTLDDLDRVVAEAHDLGMKVLADLVPNHSSHEHPWFRAATADPEGPYRDYYVWRDPAPDGGPPNNWVSHFGGPAWTLHEPTGQYYMHLFLPEQPDLNWHNEKVREEFDEILRFWFERGIDGFRIDVAHSLLEDQEFRDNPKREGDALHGEIPGTQFDHFDHVHNLDQPEVPDIYRRWNRIAAEYDAMLVGEVYVLEAERLVRYVDGGRALHSPFYFATLKARWDGREIRETLGKGTAINGDTLSWPLSSHDDPHAAERFGGGEVGARRALAYLTLLMGLPGLPFLYQGDEIGLDNGRVDVKEDPIAVRNEGAVGRDGVRTPVPWSPDEPGFGFTTGEPWLPFGSNRDASTTIAAQMDDPTSQWHRTRALLHLRRELDDLRFGPMPIWLEGHADVVAFARGDAVVAMNAGKVPREVALPAGSWTVVFDTREGRTDRPVDTEVTIAPDHAVVLRHTG